MSPPHPNAAFTALDDHRAVASVLTRGPWHDDHQHAGPPIALVCRAIEREAHVHGLTHLSRLTANLLRPVPIGELHVETATDYAGRNAGHFSARLHAQGKEVARFTALMQRENPMPLPTGLPGHPLPQAPRAPEASPVAVFPFARAERIGYGDLVETHVAAGDFFKGPSAVWFRLRHPLVAGELPSAYQRVTVAADSGNGISAILDFQKYLFLNSDLTVHLARRPHGEWICLEARTHLGPDGCGLVESRLYDTQGLIGTAAQSLSVRARE